MKSLRDCIVYTEPLTPMLQEVLHDFDTDDDDDEPKLQIVEDDAPRKNGEGTRKSDSPDMRLSKSYDKQSPKKVAENAENKQINGNVEFPKPSELSKIKSLKLKKTQTGIWENKDPVNIKNSETTEMDIETNNNISKENSENVNSTKPDTESSEKTTQRSSTSTVDTQLPNNQEGLLYREGDDKHKSVTDISVLETENKEHKRKSRKREHSQTKTETKKKLKKNKNKEAYTKTPDLTNCAESAVSSENNGNKVQINDDEDEAVRRKNVDEQSNCKSENVSKDKENKYETKPSLVSAVPEIAPSEINPCLKSVSLFAEQYSTSKCSDSDNNNQSKVKEVTATVHQDVEERKSKDNTNNASSSQKKKSTLKEDNANKQDDVLVLKSNSESDSAKSNGSSENISREKVLANLFGFSSGEFTVGHMYLDYTESA